MTTLFDKVRCDFCEESYREDSSHTCAGMVNLKATLVSEQPKPRYSDLDLARIFDTIVRGLEPKYHSSLVTYLDFPSKNFPDRTVQEVQDIAFIVRKLLEAYK